MGCLLVEIRGCEHLQSYFSIFSCTWAVPPAIAVEFLFGGNSCFWGFHLIDCSLVYLWTKRFVRFVHPGAGQKSKRGRRASVWCPALMTQLFQNIYSANSLCFVVAEKCLQVETCSLSTIATQAPHWSSAWKWTRPALNIKRETVVSWLKCVWSTLQVIRLVTYLHGAVCFPSSS